MKLEQLAFSVTSAEVETFVKTLMDQANGRGRLPDGFSNPKATLEKDHIVISIQKKMGFMPVTFSASIGLRPAEGGQGIVVTLAKISAGFIGSEAIASQIMGQIGQSLGNIPGCSVSGNDITFTKEALAAKAKWLSIPGEVKSCGITGDKLVFSIA